MIIKLNNIDKFLINLPERKDRLKRSISEINSFFTNTDFNLICGDRLESPELSIASSHIKCMKESLDKEYILIMEDDIKFISNKSFEYAQTAFDNAPPDADILLGGAYFKRGIYKYNNYWDRVEDFCALHFYIVKTSSYQKIIDNYSRGHLDRWMGPNLKCYCTKLLFTKQYNGFSDNTGKYENYDHHINKYKTI
jgi:GR25 family glycosyltransferase involved in LPS biosynthesis